jgi:DUF1680 family protein
MDQPARLARAVLRRAFDGSAVAYYEATGKRKFLDVVCRYADHIDTVFGPRENQKRGYSGHEEIELALVKLYRATNEERYLDLARYFIDERGQQPHYFDLEARARGEEPAKFRFTIYEYNQSHLPVRQQTRVVGHAVRAITWTLALHIPGWCHGAKLAVNAKAVKVASMARQDCGRIALQRGPVVYCLEEADNGPGLNDIVLPRNARLTVKQDKTVFGGMPVIVASGKRRSLEGWKDTLYRPVGSTMKALR